MQMPYGLPPNAEHATLRSFRKANAHHHPPEISLVLVTFSASGWVHDVVRSLANWRWELMGQTTSSCDVVHVEASNQAHYL